jgi:hypothetical protein
MSCCDRAVEGEPDAPAAGSAGQVVDLADDVEVGMGADSGEAGAHQTAAHDPNTGDIAHVWLPVWVRLGQVTPVQVMKATRSEHGS